MIHSIRAEELAHIDHAEDQLGGANEGSGAWALRAAIGTVTEVLIWVSTWGDSSRMARALREARRS